MKTKTSIGIAFIAVGVAVLVGAGLHYFQPGEWLQHKITVALDGHVGDNIRRAVDEVGQDIGDGIGRGLNGDFSTDRDTEREEGDIELDVQSAKKLVLANQVGRVRIVGVSGAEKGSLHYIKGIYGFDTERARQYLKNSKIDVKQSGDTLSIRTDEVTSSSLLQGRLHIDLELRIPAELAVELENKVGDIQTTNLQGSVKANSEVGAILIDGFKKEARVETKTGELQIRGGQEIKHIEAKSNVGHITVALPSDAALNVEAKTDLGSINTDFNLASTSQKVQREVKGKIGDGTQGDVQIKTNAGSIDLVKQ